METSGLSESRLTFAETFDDQTAWEAEQKGWFGAAVVELPDGRRIPVSFWDPVRLAQDLRTDVGNGACCLAVPAMILVPVVTLANMIGAVRQLDNEGYFEDLLTLGAESANTKE